jgi:hypothetical protein
MAEILAFRQRDGSERVAKRRARNVPAQIIIFPGVRYERWSDVPPAPKPKRGKSGRRAAGGTR